MRKLREKLKAGPNASELGSIATLSVTCHVTHSSNLVGQLGQLPAPHMLLATSWQLTLGYWQLRLDEWGPRWAAETCVHRRQLEDCCAMLQRRRPAELAGQPSPLS